ncbi:MAG: hypothetical protein JWM94_454 [Sphingomonas bacterium]|nr:hypothetical protein [Sphingomonas bacterium]
MQPEDAFKTIFGRFGRLLSRAETESVGLGPMLRDLQELYPIAYLGYVDCEIPKPGRLPTDRFWRGAITPQRQDLGGNRTGRLLAIR